MQRRNFLKISAAASALSLTNTKLTAEEITPKKLRPKVLKRGDTVAVIAPGTAVSDPDQIAKAKEAADYFGLNIKLGKNVIKGSGYKSRTIDERTDDFHSAFRDSDVKGVFCIRGGYGSAEILDKIDYDLVKKNPKVFLGYSDITALHLALHKNTGLVTFHGPVMLSSFSAFTVENFQKALFTSSAQGKLMNPTLKNSIRTVHPTRTIFPGKTKGMITGGNLTIICSLMGTPYEIDTRGKILLLEDVDEEPYRIDRMLTQLRLAGKLRTAAGIIFGNCEGCNNENPKSAPSWDYSLGEVLDNILGGLKIPVFSGLMFGHSSDQLTLPMGCEAEIDADECSLNITEAGVEI